MQNLQASIHKIFTNFANQKPVQCAGPESDKVEMSNPAYAQIDPHLSYDETEDLDQELPPAMRGPARRPPSFDTLLNNIKAITKKVEHIKGFKLEFVMAASPHFHIVNQWTIPGGAPPAQQGGMMGMGGPQQPGKNTSPHYGLSVQYVGGNLQQLMAQQHPSYILTGRWESNGKLECAFIKKLRKDIQLRLSAAYPTGSDLQYAQMVLDLDIEGNDYLHTLKYGSGLVSFNHMQTIGKNLVLGFELMNIMERKLSFLNYAAKYTYKRRHNFYMQYVAPQDSLTLAYNLNLKKRTHLISELNYSAKEGTTNAVVGYQQRFTNSEVITTVNSKGKISSSFNIIGMFYALKLCAIADYVKDSYKFGYGLSLGQQQ